MNVIMTIAGSDSGAGAGIQADLKTIAAMKEYGTSVITALTAQNTLGVNAIMPVPTDFIEQQFKAIISDFDVKAVKIGMLPNEETIDCVAHLLRNSQIGRVVLDPVMVATSGDKLTTSDTAKALKQKLFPLITMVTPNVYEAELLLERKITCLKDADEAALELAYYYSKAIVIKGGHLNIGNENEKIVDVYASTKRRATFHFSKPRIVTNNLHGTGCTMSAALAVWLARGSNERESFRKVHTYMSKSIIAGRDLKLGQGNGPLWHFV